MTSATSAASASTKSGTNAKVSSKSKRKSERATVVAGNRSNSNEEKTTRERLEKTAEKVRTKTGEVLEEAREAASETYERSAAEGQKAYRAASEQVRSVSSQIGDFAREHPLAVCAIGFAGGLIVGSMLPRTRLENEKLGEYRDQLVEKGRETVQSAMKKERASEPGYREGFPADEETASPAS